MSLRMSELARAPGRPRRAVAVADAATGPLAAIAWASGALGQTAQTGPLVVTEQKRTLRLVTGTAGRAPTTVRRAALTRVAYAPSPVLLAGLPPVRLVRADGVDVLDPASGGWSLAW